MLISYNRGNGFAAFVEAGVAAFALSRYKRGKPALFKRHAVTTLPFAINWGCAPGGLIRATGRLAQLGYVFDTMLNADLRPAHSKVVCYQKLTEADLACPRLLTKEEAQDLINNDAEATVFGRTDGLHSGHGISVYRRGDTVGVHQFYTAGIPRKHEVRIHVGRLPDGEYNVIAMQYKRCRDVGPIGSHRHGAQFSASTLVDTIGPKTTARSKEIAINAVDVCGLDFAAVDIIIDASTGRPAVLELNSAPGIETASVRQAYVAFFVNPFTL